MSITARLLNIFDFDTGMGEVTWVVRKDKQHTTYQIGMNLNALSSSSKSPNKAEIQKIDVIVTAALFSSACNLL